MNKRRVDYQLYLVTDSTPEILGDRDICQVIEEALKGGVTIIQYRDKRSSTETLVSTARKLHAITKKFSVPLLINDRVDVALAIGCEGVHIGQDDMQFSDARRLLGDNSIIGVTVSNTEQAIAAVNAGADYLGVGTVFATPTKKDTKEIIGIAGLRHILETTNKKTGKKTPAVCIGGIGPRNVERVLHQASSESHPLAGVAVVSAIMAAKDAASAAKKMRDLLNYRPFSLQHDSIWPLPLKHIDSPVATEFPCGIERISTHAQALQGMKPIIHNMTNTVVQNFTANVALAIGASPIMTLYAGEAPDLASYSGALVINTGTATPDTIDNCVAAIETYNRAHIPIVLDPVGAGATAFRRKSLARLLESGYFTVIKGNESEINTVISTNNPNPTKIQQQQKGVDSASSEKTPNEIAADVQQLALRERCVVVMTGVSDYVSDGVVTVRIRNGHEYLSQITGTGCALGTVIAAYLASRGQHATQLQAVVTAMLHYEVAAEITAESEAVQGPASFQVAFVDQLSTLRKNDNLHIIGDRANFEIMDANK